MGREDGFDGSLNTPERPEEARRRGALEVIAGAEGILRSFTDLSSRGESGLRPWEGLLFTSVRARLNGTPDERYLLGLRQAARGASSEKERIVAAAYAYELSNWETMKQRPAYYNHRVLFRAAIELAESEEGLVGEVARVGLARIPLSAIKSALLLGKDKNVKDPSWLAELAYGRRSGEEADDAKKLLQEVEDGLFVTKVGRSSRRDAKTFISRINVGAYDIDLFPIAVVDYFFRDLQANDPDFFETVFQELKAEEGRILAKGVTEDKKAFEAFLQGLPRGEYQGTYTHQRNVLTIMRRLFVNVPILAERHQRYVEEISRRAEVEAAERACALEEARIAHEEVQRRKQKEEEDQRKAEAKISYDRLLEEISQIEVDGEALDHQIRSRVSDEIPNLLGNLYQSHEWRVLRCPRRPRQALSDIDRLVTEVSWQHLLSRDPESLTSAWEARRPELSRLIEERLDASIPKILEAVDKRFTFAHLPSDRNAQESHVWHLGQLIGYFTPRLEAAREERTRGFLTQLIALLRAKRDAANEEFAREEREAKQREHQEAIISIREDYLRETIERQIEYLKHLYEASLGVSLPPVGSRASHEEGSVVGSVSLGMSLRHTIRHEMRLEHRLNLLAERDAIELEMGESIDSLLARRAMVDWVVPHEVAHLVDFQSPAIASVLEKDVLEPGAELLRHWRGAFGAIAKEVLTLTFDETAIDGIGFRLLTEYGVSDPAAVSRPARIEAAMRGYAAMLPVIRQILHTHADTPEMKARYALLLLRNRANGEFLLEEGERSGARTEVISEIRDVLVGFEGLFMVLNTETEMVSPDQTQPVINLCKTIMRNAKDVPLEKWSKKRED